jgi:superfamily II DNA helicase RecQ/predicted amidophosphoribosyltransferase
LDIVTTDLPADLWARHGYAHPTDGQREVIQHILAAKDVLALIPPGGGKIGIVRIAAGLVPGHTVFVTPHAAAFSRPVPSGGDVVVALAADVANGADSTIVLHHDLPAPELERRLSALSERESALLIIDPPMLDHPPLTDLLANGSVSLAAADSAHSISRWSHDRREDYAPVRNLRERLRPASLVAFAVTDSPVVLGDIATELDLLAAERVIAAPDRRGLRLRVESFTDAGARLAGLYPRVRSAHGRTLVLTQDATATDEVAAMLEDMGIDAVVPDRPAAHDAPIGAGVDTGGVLVAPIGSCPAGGPRPERILHLWTPPSLATYFEAVGHAGPGATCVLLTTPRDLDVERARIDASGVTKDDLEAVYNAIAAPGDGGAVDFAAIAAMSRLIDTTIEQALADLTAMAVIERAGGADGREAAYRTLRDTLAPGELARFLGREEQVRKSALQRLAGVEAYVDGGECRWVLLARSATPNAAAQPCGECDVCAPPSQSATGPAPREMLERLAPDPTTSRRAAKVPEPTRPEPVPPAEPEPPAAAPRPSGNGDPRAAILEFVATSDRSLTPGALAAALAGQGDGNAVRTAISALLDSGHLAMETRIIEGTPLPVLRVTKIEPPIPGPRRAPPPAAPPVPRTEPPREEKPAPPSPRRPKQEFKPKPPPTAREDDEIDRAIAGALRAAEAMREQTREEPPPRPERPKARPRTRGNGQPPAQGVDVGAEDYELLARLQEWRRETARRRGTKPYAIMNDKNLVEIARARPKTPDDLQALRGIGPKKVENWGDEVLAVVAGTSRGMVSPAPAAAETPAEPIVGSIGPHIERLSLTDARAKIDAIKRLKELGDPRALPALEALSTDAGESLTVRLYAGIAKSAILGRAGPAALDRIQMPHAPIKPKKLRGAWDVGYALNNLTGRRADGWARTELGHMVHRFRVDHDESVMAGLAMAVATFVRDSAEYRNGEPLVLSVPSAKGPSGYDAVSALAHKAADLLGYEAAPEIIVKSRETKPQLTQRGRLRKYRNVRGAFGLTHPERVKGRFVLLIDDLYDTGYTMGELTRILRKAGAAKVAVVALVRTVKDSPINS